MEFIYRFFSKIAVISPANHHIHTSIKYILLIEGHFFAMSFNKFSSEIKSKTENIANDNSKAAPEKSAKMPDQAKGKPLGLTQVRRDVSDR